MPCHSSCKFFVSFASRSGGPITLQWFQCTIWTSFSLRCSGTAYIVDQHLHSYVLYYTSSPTGRTANKSHQLRNRTVSSLDQSKEAVLKRPYPQAHPTTPSTSQSKAPIQFQIHCSCLKLPLLPNRQRKNNNPIGTKHTQSNRHNLPPRLNRPWNRGSPQHSRR